MRGRIHAKICLLYRSKTKIYVDPKPITHSKPGVSWDSISWTISEFRITLKSIFIPEYSLTRRIKIVKTGNSKKIHVLSKTTHFQEMFPVVNVELHKVLSRAFTSMEFLFNLWHRARRNVCENSINKVNAICHEFAFNSSYIFSNHWFQHSFLLI